MVNKGCSTVHVTAPPLPKVVSHYRDMVPRSIVMVTHLEYLGIDSILFLEIKTDKLDCQVRREAAQLGLKRTPKENNFRLKKRNIFHFLHTNQETALNHNSVTKKANFFKYEITIVFCSKM